MARCLQREASAQKNIAERGKILTSYEVASGKTYTNVSACRAINIITMPHYPTWDYVPVLHDFKHVASIPWPGQAYEQLDWIIGVTTVEEWLQSNIGSKYERWAWNMATESYQVSVAFKWAKHKTLFLLVWS